MLQLPPEQWMKVALSHQQCSRLAEAEKAYRLVLELQPDHVQAINNLGVVLLHLDRPEEALACFERALVIEPGFVEAISNVGTILEEKGQFDEAIRCHQHALQLSPNSAGAYYNLGVTLGKAGLVEKAIASYQRAVQLKPDYAEAYNNLGNAFKHTDRPDDAVACHMQALRLRPGFAEAHCNLGEALAARGDLDQALGAFHEAVRLRPARADIHSDLLFALHFHQGLDERAIDRECRAWDQQHAEPIRGFILPHDNDRKPDRPLRIGLISPDFRRHCQSLFTVPLLSHLDSKQFRIVGYSSVARPDDLTARLRSLCTDWRDISRMSDAQAAELIRQDRIDILVDLCMHMSENRALVLARKPAPVQAAWLAYPGTTGMRAMDYRISDPYLDPTEIEPGFVEKTLRLADTFWCYDPLTDGPDVNELPALSSSSVTFGCLNNFLKVNDQVLNLWAQVLAAVKDSRIILLCPQGTARQRVLEAFAARGIASERVEFLGHGPRDVYLRHYHRIDIGLDTFPYNGHTTSLDSLWMGVPVVTLVGSTVVGRAGLSQLTNLGLSELVARSPEEYLRITAALAGDRTRHGELRMTLRQRMHSSPLMDAPRFARSFETLLRHMWHEWCAKPDVRR